MLSCGRHAKHLHVNGSTSAELKKADCFLEVSPSPACRYRGICYVRADRGLVLCPCECL